VVTEQELLFIQSVVDQVAIAISQSILLNQVRSVGRQQALASVITKVRESLDLNEIFETTTQELRRVLNADRVVVQNELVRLFLPYGISLVWIKPR